MKHWAVDLGTRDLTHILSRKSNCHALLSRFSRLLVDCNRPVSSSTLMRKDADHEKVLLNADISDKDLHHRLNEYYYPYHEAMQVLCRHPEIHLVCSIHSFTPSYEGRKREVEIGVLYDGDHNKQLAEVVTKRYVLSLSLSLFIHFVPCLCVCLTVCLLSLSLSVFALSLPISFSPYLPTSPLFQIL